VFVDASALGLIRELKIGYGEYLNYHLLKPEILEGWISSPRNEPKIVPVNFAEKRREMLEHLYNVLAKRKIRIHPSFDNVAVALRTATTKGDNWDLDKEMTSEDDILDALQLSLLNSFFRKN
jgi:hypothetical protein